MCEYVAKRLPSGCSSISQTPSSEVNCGGSGVSEGAGAGEPPLAFGAGARRTAARTPGRRGRRARGFHRGGGDGGDRRRRRIRYLRVRSELREPGGGRGDPEDHHQADAEVETTEVHLVCFSRTSSFAAWLRPAANRRRLCQPDRTPLPPMI